MEHRPIEEYNCLVVLGPTASGKTRLACVLATALGGEIISADSRQVYKQLNIGTGKDLAEYQAGGTPIPYHLIDIADPSKQYFLHDYIRDLRESFEDISERKRFPIVCGGTGLYLDALSKDFSFTAIPENLELRKKLLKLEKGELIRLLEEFPQSLTAHVDRNSAKRLIRGIEVATYLSSCPEPPATALPYRPLYIGVDIGAAVRNERIAERLLKRMDEGLVQEGEFLLKNGLSHERMAALGLEYRFLSEFLKGAITEQQFISGLQSAIQQYAKRQMTWFRRMEKQGIRIHWFRHDLPQHAIIEEVQKLLGRSE